MMRLLKEPLLHFCVLGALLFVLYGVMQKPDERSPDAIVVTQGQIAHLASGFAKTWQRPPTPEEMAGLVREWVREEVYYREAMALGLERDDTVVRRRLRQKMEFISEDTAAQQEPTEADLAEYLGAHPESFRTEARYSFRQVYLSPERRGESLADAVAQLREQLQELGADADLSQLGDPLLLEPEYLLLPGNDVANLFGETFAERLAELSPGQWQGPVESGYGVHLVWVSERIEASLPVLADVRDAVLREWRNARRLEANERFYAQLLERYTVTIEDPEPDSVSQTPLSGQSTGTQP